MSIFEELIQRVSNGETFDVNFNTRTMRVGKTYLIKNGDYNGEPLGVAKVDTNTAMQIIEQLYEEYKFSLPSERSEKQRRKYFKALPIEEIPDEKLFNAKRREFAQAKLEGYILCAILQCNLTWDENWGNWYWQSKTDSDLVILRNWIENKNN